MTSAEHHTHDHDHIHGPGCGHASAERELHDMRSGANQWDPISKDPEISGLDLQVGGEGMKHFYDELLPKRLQKLVKQFGGTVERSSVPITKTVTEDVPGFSVLDNWGHMRGWWPTR